MEISLLVAKVLGGYFVVSGLFLLFRGKTLPTMLKDFFNHPAIVYLTGVILAALSGLYLLQNNIWDGTWRVAVTVIMWLTLIKGLMYILVPEKLHAMASKRVFNSLSAYGVLAIAAGVALFYIGG